MWQFYYLYERSGTYGNQPAFIRLIFSIIFRGKYSILVQLSISFSILVKLKKLKLKPL